MNAVIGSVARLLAAVSLIACGVARVQAQAVPENTAADQSPRYLPQDSSAVRPLEATEVPISEPLPANAPRAGQPNRIGPPGERLASGGDDPAAPRAISAPAAAALPLAPPVAQARVARRGELSPLATGVASLAIVLGLFLVIVWAVRRGIPKGAGLLPPEVLEVLGRAPLVGKQQVHLLRCGNKVLLVCVCGMTVQTLTEITDSAEVERLSELCHAHGVAAATPFAHVLRQFSSSSRSGGYLAADVDPSEYGSLDTDLTHVRGSLA